ncbi:2-amino-4-hydroxy-6-hydroxymethyldihydropteridine diphosphokinase [Novosphingobium sp. FSY-8]|uniref:2-amino-4-hydroxy-6-hydroxymethyldihydropteridine pyrophosphokinase n=1 Tax=Novosphingobium ovatum TaxID=1908523 RepID=A0ABW9XDT9_9SPHN|nr:2-amino-4-hydroxy-6-hydroxymethyldihydropteridine diphosphokinase [Novosphingobium ovatum]NBC36617.1 2-amino-4-hydroxy-6-hydroxymethyldihydropteridine diphosphokinase [Novosphingobium ovatum]
MSEPQTTVTQREWRYVLALGSNVPHGRFGAPEGVLAAAVRVLAGMRALGVTLEAVAPVMTSDPVGPSLRRYANGAVVVRSRLAPDALLAVVKHVEAAFGRRPGQRWGSRVLDIDIVLWDGGIWRQSNLYVPHRAYRSRDFVLRPAAAIAPYWRDPHTGLTLRQQFARLTRSRHAPRGTPRPARVTAV